MRTTPGMTLIELMVVILIVAALAALIIAAQQPDRDVMRKSSCGNSQRQIVLAMLVYANENDGLWPCRPSDATGRPTRTPGRDKFTTISSFEFLAAQTGKEMPAKIFACPVQRTFRPPTEADPKIDWGSPIVSGWVTAAARDPRTNPGYVYDWSAPPNADAMRVVTADRGRGSFGHKQVVMACFGDGHVNHLKVAQSDDPTMTRNLDDSPCDIGAVNPDGRGDDVFTSTGDGEAVLIPGKGSATRAWVR